MSVKLRTNAASAPSPSLLPSLASFSPPLRKGRAEGGKDAVSLPSIWCCMPLSGCQPAHSNEGCHQGYCTLEWCLLLLGSLSFFILLVQDTGRIYKTATHQPTISFKKQKTKKRQLYHYSFIFISAHVPLRQNQRIIKLFASSCCLFLASCLENVAEI